MTLIPDETRGAVIDGEYRYTLFRVLGPAVPQMLWIMLNPSTADGTEDDATIRRCTGYARAWGYGRYTVANFFAYRSTDPKALRKAKDPIGPRNIEVLLEEVQRHNLVVLACGDPGWEFGRKYVWETMSVLARHRPLHCLGFAGDPRARASRMQDRPQTTAEGFPVHPLRQPASLVPVIFRDKVLT